MTIKLVKQCLWYATLSCLLISACSSSGDKVFRIDIDDAADHAKFVEILTKTNRPFDIDSKGRVLVSAKSYEELQVVMAEYREWQQVKYDVVDADALVSQ